MKFGNTVNVLVVRVIGRYTQARFAEAAQYFTIRPAVSAQLICSISNLVHYIFSQYFILFRNFSGNILILRSCISPFKVTIYLPYRLNLATIS